VFRENEPDKAFRVTLPNDQPHVFECTIHALAPTCEHCGVGIIGHGVEANDSIYCCAYCASMVGASRHKTAFELLLKRTVVVQRGTLASKEPPAAGRRPKTERGPKTFGRSEVKKRTPKSLRACLPPQASPPDRSNSLMDTPRSSSG